MNNTNNQSARMSFEFAKTMFGRAFRNNFATDEATMQFVNSLKLSQSEIRLEVLLNANNNTFTFGVTTNQIASGGNQPFITEKRLNMQDSLCVNEYAILVGFPSSTAATNWRLNTYGNTQIFTGANVATALDTTFYANGGFQIKVNNDVICPYRGMWNHYYRPQTQQTDALGVGSPGDQQRGAEDGMVTAEPNVVLIGSKNYVPEIVLPSAMAGTFTTERAILIMRGVLAQNSTVVS